MIIIDRDRKRDSIKKDYFNNPVMFAAMWYNDLVVIMTCDKMEKFWWFLIVCFQKKDSRRIYRVQFFYLFLSLEENLTFRFLIKQRLDLMINVKKIWNEFS